MDVGVIAAGRIGQAVLRRLAPFDVRLHYFDTHRVPPEVEEELGLTFHPDARSLARSVDVVSIHAPLHPQTYHLFDADVINSMRRGFLHRQHCPSRDRGSRRDRQGPEPRTAGRLRGDVWYPQPPAVDHPWRTMPHEAMTPHVSGTTLSARARSAAGTREILEDFFAGPRRPRRVSDRQGRRVGRHRGKVLHRQRNRQPGQPLRLAHAR
jgi:formate dehydrogenase